MKNNSGNVMIIILVTIALFAALIFAFTRTNQQGGGNLTAQQSKMLAQELASFFNQVDMAVQKLRQKGCSETDISFANPKDTGAYVAANDPATAPADGSCDVFNSNGGKVTFNMDWSKYQVPVEEDGIVQPPNIYFRQTNASNVGIGTSTNDIMAHLNSVIPDICRAYNSVLGIKINTAVNDSGNIAGDENADYKGKATYCRYFDGSEYGQIRYVWIAR